MITITRAFKKDFLVRISLSRRVNLEYNEACLVLYLGLRSNSSNFFIYFAVLKHSCAFSLIFR